MLEPVGPVVGGVQVMPFTPEIDQVPVPEGVGPVEGPATVAVKVNVEPSEIVVALVVTVIVGINLVTVTVAVALDEGPV